MAKAEKTTNAENVVAMGGNIKGLYDEIKEAADELLALEKERKAINDKMAEIRSRLEAKGLIKKGQSAALTYFKLSPEDKKNFDQTYIMMREGMGVPIKGAQLDLNLNKDQKEA